jgi:poly-gamma-glutamate capsule biosynthesis protein CapA/YwtB (metallophosphatase superfamily)
MENISQPSEPENQISITAVGDVMLGRAFSERFDELADKWLPPQIRSQLQAHIVFCNLECPLSDVHTPAPGKIGLHAKEKSIRAIKHGNFNVVSLANNHMMDFGLNGLSRTLKLLDENDIKHAGAGMTLDESRKPAIIKVGNITVGILAYISPFYFGETIKIATVNSPGLAPFDIAMVKEDINSMKKECDIVMVSVHWGIENTYYVPPRNIKAAQEVLSAGADIILGHHPHVIQGYEMHKGKIVLYSLGNFLFPALSDKSHWEKRHRTSLIFKCVMAKSGRLIDYGFIPILQEGENNPILTIPGQDYSDEVLRNMQKWSQLYSKSYYPLEFNLGHRKDKLRDSVRSTVVHIKEEGFINTLKKTARIKRHISRFFMAK